MVTRKQNDSIFLQQQRRHDQLSALAVIGMTCIALLFGWIVRYGVEQQTRVVSRLAVTAVVPEDWSVQRGGGDLVLVARNPAEPAQLFEISMLPASSNLAKLATQRSLVRGRQNDTYRVLDEMWSEWNGQNAYRVRYAYVNLRQPGVPTVIEGISTYFVSSEKTIIASFEDLSSQFEDSAPRFERLVERVRYVPTP